MSPDDIIPAVVVVAVVAIICLVMWRSLTPAAESTYTRHTTAHWSLIERMTETERGQYGAALSAGRCLICRARISALATGDQS